MGDFAYVNYLHLCRVSTNNEAEFIYCMQLPVVYTILTHTHLPAHQNQVFVQAKV